jgi:HPr kinase/phosphorylase
MVANLVPTIHASAVLVGAHAVLIRGPSGSGKSRLALELIQAAESGQLAFARLVADDRVRLQVRNGRLLAEPPAELAGLIEIRGLGIHTLPFEHLAVVGGVVDLAAKDGQRLPTAAEAMTAIEGIALPRLALAAGSEPLPAVLAWLRTRKAGV